VLPLVMVLLDYYFNRKYNWKVLVEKLPFFTISFIFGVIALYSQQSSLQDLAPTMSLLEHVAVISNSFISYILKVFIPVHLSALYPYPAEIGSTLPLAYYLSILCVVLLVFFVWYSRRWSRDI